MHRRFNPSSDSRRSRVSRRLAGDSLRTVSSQGHGLCDDVPVVLYVRVEYVLCVTSSSADLSPGARHSFGWSLDFVD